MQHSFPHRRSSVRALVFMLAERFKITQAVGQYKAVHGLPPADGAREKAQIERLRALAKRANLDPEFSENFLRFIIAEVIRPHERSAEHTSALQSLLPISYAVFCMKKHKHKT